MSLALIQGMHVSIQCMIATLEASNLTCIYGFTGPIYALAELGMAPTYIYVKKWKLISQFFN